MSEEGHKKTIDDSKNPHRKASESKIYGASRKSGHAGETEEKTVALTYLQTQNLKNGPMRPSVTTVQRTVRHCFKREARETD